MTATLDDVAARKKGKPEPTAEQKLAEELVARALVRKPARQLRHMRSPIKSTAASPVTSSKHSRASTERMAKDRIDCSYLQYIKATG